MRYWFYAVFSQPLPAGLLRRETTEKADRPLPSGPPSGRECKPPPTGPLLDPNERRSEKLLMIVLKVGDDWLDVCRRLINRCVNCIRGQSEKEELCEN
jgi:hypothetical protein